MVNQAQRLELRGGFSRVIAALGHILGAQLAVKIVEEAHVVAVELLLRAHRLLHAAHAEEADEAEEAEEARGPPRQETGADCDVL